MYAAIVKLNDLIVFRSKRSKNALKNNYKSNVANWKFSTEYGILFFLFSRLLIHIMYVVCVCSTYSFGNMYLYKCSFTPNYNGNVSFFAIINFLHKNDNWNYNKYYLQSVNYIYFYFISFTLINNKKNLIPSFICHNIKFQRLLKIVY